MIKIYKLKDGTTVLQMPQSEFEELTSIYPVSFEYIDGVDADRIDLQRKLSEASFDEYKAELDKFYSDLRLNHPDVALKLGV